MCVNFIHKSGTCSLRVASNDSSLRNFLMPILCILRLCSTNRVRESRSRIFYFSLLEVPWVCTVASNIPTPYILEYDYKFDFLAKYLKTKCANADTLDQRSLYTVNIKPFPHISIEENICLVFHKIEISPQWGHNIAYIILLYAVYSAYVRCF